MAKLITKRDRNILIDSKIIEDYPVLKNFIDETPNWDDKKLNELNDETILFFNNIYPKVFNQATREWTVDMSSVEYFTGKNTMQCELCGQRPIKKICTIENKFTDKKMKIGTECVKHFGISKGAEIEKLIEQSRKIKKLEGLNALYPGIEKDIINWNYFLEDQPILIRKTVSERYILEGSKAKKLLAEYLDNKTSIKRCNKIVEELALVFRKKNNEMKRILDYVEINKGKLLIPDRELINSLKVSDMWNVIDMLEEDGVIKHRTLFRIKNEPFAKSLISIINEEISGFNCTIDNVVFDKGLGYQYKHNNKNRIKLFCSYYDFCFSYYNFITGDYGDNINFEGLLKMSRIYGESSIESALYELFGLIRSTEYSLEENIYHEYNDFYVYNKKNKSYYEIELDSLIKEFTEDLFIRNKSSKDRFYNYILNMCKNPISKKDMDYINDTRNRGISQGI